MSNEMQDKSYLYKYQQVNKYSLNALINRQLFFAKPCQFNDPFDAQLLPEDYINELGYLGYSDTDLYINNANSYVCNELNTCGIVSLSKTCNDILMWSHYADAHKGFCLGFENDLQIYFKEHEWRIENKPIRYLSHNEHPYRAIHSDYISKKRFNSGHGFLDQMELSSSLLEAAITIKHFSWSYEQEVRIVSDFCGPHYFDKEALDHVILGMKISREDEMIICSLLDNELWKHVRIFKAEKGKAMLSVEIRDVSKNNDGSNINCSELP